MEITFSPLEKQMNALNYLFDNKTTEILFGGSSGGGKSYLACAWIIMCCLKYPGTRWVIARSRLSILKITTVKTFRDIIIDWGLEDRVEYHLFNNHINFTNGSEVLLMDLFLYPADPDFVKLGSLELTGAVIDEAAEIDERAYTILTTRFRYKLSEYDLIPKLLIVSNPTRGWIYNNFYRAQKEGSIEDYRKFIKSLPKDNPYLTKEYVEQLKRLPELDRRRLYLGEWEFTQDDFDIFNIDDLYNSFYVNGLENSNSYITCDVAGSGNDKTVITYWDGYMCKEIRTYSKIDTLRIVEHIKNMMTKHNVPIKHVIVDSIGIGQGVADTLKCKKFIASNKPNNNEHFNNLKTQLFFKFAELVNNGEIGISYDGNNEDIVDELISHKRHKGDQDGKYQITPKELVKRTIGRSPDIADALVMRMYFEYKSEISFSFI